MANRRGVRAVVAPRALRDIREILRWSQQEFGKAARSRYAVLITQAVADVGDDPERPSSKARPEFMIAGARTYHIALSRDRVGGDRVQVPRHFLVYRQRADGIVEVARVLHDSHDLLRHSLED